MKHLTKLILLAMVGVVGLPLSASALENSSNTVTTTSTSTISPELLKRTNNNLSFHCHRNSHCRLITRCSSSIGGTRCRVCHKPGHKRILTCSFRQARYLDSRGYLCPKTWVRGKCMRWETVRVCH